jgi:hypothetical protein
MMAIGTRGGLTRSATHLGGNAKVVKANLEYRVSRRPTET